MLRACKKLLRPGGRSAFQTISIAPAVSKREHRRAARIGPRAVSSNRTPEELMDAAGFDDVVAIDVTNEFLRVARAWQEQYESKEAQLRALFGDELDELHKDRRDLIAGVEEGLLRRTLVSGRKP